MTHLRNMYLWFFGATLVTFFLGIGTTVTGSWILAGIAAALVAGFAVLGGIFGTMQMRQRLGLMQTGRLLQWASFTVCAYVGLLLCGLVLGPVAGLFSLAAPLTIASPLLSAVTLFALAFGPALLFGEVPWKGRTWLPVRMPNR
jgi:hypothetical protein